MSLLNSEEPRFAELNSILMNIPPPNDDDDDATNDDDKEDEPENDGPAVVREPDEDE